MSPDTRRGKWPPGRIVKLFRGKDSKVRVVEVQVGQTAAETNCETLPLGALLNFESRYKKKMHCFKSWTFHRKHCICRRFC